MSAPAAPAFKYVRLLRGNFNEHFQQESEAKITDVSGEPPDRSDAGSAHVAIAEVPEDLYAKATESGDTFAEIHVRKSYGEWTSEVAVVLDGDCCPFAERDRDCGSDCDALGLDELVEAYARETDTESGSDTGGD
jgi:hypothetical protein